MTGIIAKMSYKNSQKFFRLFLLAAFLLMVYAEGFHHHQDNISHADCPYCAAAQQTVIVSSDTDSLVVSHDVQIVSCDTVPEFISLNDRRPSFVRGPPA